MSCGKFQERTRQETELPEPLQSEDLPKYQGGSLGSFREGLQMLPNAALKAMGKDKVCLNIYILEQILVFKYQVPCTCYYECDVGVSQSGGCGDTHTFTYVLCWIVACTIARRF